MKNFEIKLAVVSLLLLILTNCGRTEQKSESSEQKIDASKSTVPAVEEAPVAEEAQAADAAPGIEDSAANVTVKIFFQTRDMSGYEGYEQKPTTSERAEFRKNKKYTFCYDSEEYNNLQIIGTGENLTLTVKSGGRKIFDKSNFDVKGKKKFTTKDFILEMGEEYTLILKQKEKVLFKGKIDSQGCM